MHRLQLFSFFLLACVCSLFSNTARAQWQPLNAPFGTNIYYVFEADGTLFTLTLSSTYRPSIYRSGNGGTSWTQIDTSEDLRSYVKVGNILFATASNGVRTSNDDGQTWTPLQSDLPAGSAGLIVYNGSRLYVTTGKGLYTSTNNGVNWTSDNEGLPYRDISAIEFIGSTVFLGLDSDMGGAGESGLYTKSTTGSWTEVATTTTTISGISGLKAIGNTLFITSRQGPSYRSEDMGHTWTYLPAFPQIRYPNNIVYIGSTLFTGTFDSGVLRSTDNGTTWSPTALQSINVNSLALRGSTLVAGTNGGGIYLSHDGGDTWQQSNTGLKSTTRISAMASGSGILYALPRTPNNIYKSSDGGLTWSTTQQRVSTNATIKAVAAINSRLFAGTESRGVFYSDDNGDSWHASTGIANGKGVFSFFQDGSAILAGIPVYPSSELQVGAYLSKDGGLTWTATDLGKQAYCFVRHNGALYAGIIRDIMKSDDGGEHWVMASPMFYTQSDVLALASNGSTLFAGTSGHGAYLTHDNGSTWQQVLHNVPGVTSVTSFAVYQNTVFAGTNAGVFKTEDNGATWERVSEGMEEIPVQNLVIANYYLYAGTDGEAVWRRPLSEMTPTSVAEGAPGQMHYSLLPHPVNSSSVLRLCSTCELHNATLTLSTMSGQGVRTTGNLYGTSVVIEKDDLAAGVYAFTLEEAGRVVASGTIVIE